MSALRRNLPQISWKSQELPEGVLESLRVTKEDFLNAIKVVEPSAMREIMIEIPNVKWTDVGGLQEVKDSLREAVEWPLKHGDAFRRIGIRPPLGILLYGPPGTGKTLLARAVASEAGANFISVKGPEVFTKWVGESEKKIREIFRRAKQVAPSIIFFDEMDAVAPRRGTGGDSHVTENVVSQILTEMSGIEDLHDVVIVAATNRPDIIDPALLRPGRFDRQMLVPAPDEDARLDILKIHTKEMPVAKDVDLKKIARELDGFTGADIEALVREAGMNALRESFSAKMVTKKHFEEAKEKVKPSVSSDVIKFYDQLSGRLREADIEPRQAKRKEIDYVG